MGFCTAESCLYMKAWAASSTQWWKGSIHSHELNRKASTLLQSINFLSALRKVNKDTVKDVHRVQLTVGVWLHIFTGVSSWKVNNWPKWGRFEFLVTFNCHIVGVPRTGVLVYINLAHNRTYLEHPPMSGILIIIRWLSRVHMHVLQTAQYL